MDNPNKELSRDEIERIGLAQSVNFMSRKYKMDEDHNIAVQALVLRHNEITLKNLETVLLSNREQMRPHVQYRAEVAFEVGSGKYKCQLPIMSSMMEEGELESDLPIAAYGETPAQACDNFDALWVGRNRDVS